VLYLGYTFVRTPYAREHEAEFWQWMRERELWFYAGLTMVRGWTWTIELIGDQADAIHHLVQFDGDPGLAAYRRVLHARAADDPAWEARRAEQDRWYTITARTVQRTLPAMMGPPSPETAMQLPELRPPAVPVAGSGRWPLPRLCRIPLMSARRTEALTGRPL
jgi:hypothetical protein